MAYIVWYPVCVGCHGNAAGSGSGSDIEPSPVAMLVVLTNSSDSSITVSWEEAENTTYTVSYNITYIITVGGVQLSSKSSATSDTVLMVTDDAVVPGVTVTVSVLVSNSMGLTSNLTVREDIVDGGMPIDMYCMYLDLVCGGLAAAEGALSVVFIGQGVYVCMH